METMETIGTVANYVRICRDYFVGVCCSHWCVLTCLRVKLPVWDSLFNLLLDSCTTVW